MNLISKLPSKLTTGLLALLSGILFSIGFPNIYKLRFVSIQILGVALFLYIILHKSKNFKQRILNYLLFSLTACISIVPWLPAVLKEYGNIYPPLNYMLGSIYVLILAPYFLIFIISLVIVKKIPFIKSIKIDSHLHKGLIIAIFLTIFELHTPQLFPAIIGHSWIKYAPFLSAAKIFGTTIFSFIGYWIAITLVNIYQNKMIDWMAISLSLIIILLNVLFPLKLYEDNQKLKKNNIRLVQANIGNLMKILSEDGKIESLKYVYTTYRDMSLLPSKKPLDLIIWPETAYPNPQDAKFIQENPTQVPKLFTYLLNKTKAEFLVGGYNLPMDSNDNMFQTEHNSLFFFKEKNKKAILDEVYNKIELLPFGETLPFGALNKYLSKIVSNISYFKKGNKYSLFKTRNNTYFTTAICYEILFPDFIGNYLRNVEHHPQFIVNVTNDSWFGNTLEPYQHLFSSRWRAIEFQIPIVRMTNTGISSVLYPDGSESKRLPLFKKDILDIELITPVRKPTIFQKIGLLPIYLLFLILSLGYYLFACFKKPACNRS